MALPRLAPSAQPLDVTITVNERLRPYFTQWFQDEKQEGETPENFAIRQMKKLAMRSYITSVYEAEVLKVTQAQSLAEADLSTDIVAIETEVE